MAADHAAKGLQKESTLDPTSFASVAQLLDRDGGYRLDSEYNRSAAEFFTSKHPSETLTGRGATSGQYHKFGSGQENDSAIRGLSLRLTVRFKTILATRLFLISGHPFLGAGPG